jgi:hypothetical protein
MSENQTTKILSFLLKTFLVCMSFALIYVSGIAHATYHAVAALSLQTKLFVLLVTWLVTAKLWYEIDEMHIRRYYTESDKWKHVLVGVTGNLMNVLCWVSGSAFWGYIAWSIIAFFFDGNNNICVRR